MLYEKEGAEIKNRVSLCRKELGITQEQLAKEVGISRPYLSDIENGKRQVSGAVMIRIAHCLGVNVEDIFFACGVQHVRQKSKAV